MAEGKLSLDQLERYTKLIGEYGPAHLSPAGQRDLLRHITALQREADRLREAVDRAEDKGFILGARFGWNCAVEEWEPSSIERGMSRDTWDRREKIRAERRASFDAAIAARRAALSAAQQDATTQASEDGSQGT